MLIEPLFVQQIVDMYSAGKSQKEITETTGQKYSVVRYWLKKKGIYDSSRRQHNTSGCQDYNLEEKTKAHFDLLDKLHKNGFKLCFSDGLVSAKRRVNIECQNCGEIFSRVPKYWNYECPECGESATRRKEREEEQARIEEERKRLQQEKEERERLEIQRIYNKQFEKQICKECGKEFTLFEYRKLVGSHHVEHTVYCSQECRANWNRKKRRENNKTRGKHLKRARKYKCEYESGITIKKVVARDGLTCAICGEPCNFNDKTYGNGSGPYYPSIDHVIPLSKGGGHTWNNVQIAHIICNALKNDKVV